MKDSQPWWVAKDVCDVLEITNSRDALKRLDDDEKGVGNTDTLGGVQSVQIVNEPGLYSLVLRSTKPEAKAFKRWITHEIIPAIRTTGSYVTPTANKFVEFDEGIARLQQLLSTVGIVAGKVVEQDTRLTLVENKVEGIESAMLAAREATVAPLTVVPGTLRDEVRIAVDTLVALTGLSHHDAWTRVYREFEQRAHVRLSAHQKNKENKIDCVERLGKLYQLQAVAANLVQKAQA